MKTLNSLKFNTTQTSAFTLKLFYIQSQHIHDKTFQDYPEW